MSLLALLKYWREGLIVLLLAACTVQSLRLAWCQNEIATAAAAAEKAKNAALADAQMRSDRIIAEQAGALAATAAKAQTITERIIHVPVTTACAQSPAMRAATDGVRDLLAGGGQAKAGGGAPVALHGPGARAKP